MGNGDVIECTANTALSKMTYGGICKTKLSQRKWTHWAKTSWLTYEAEKKVEVPETYTVKKGDILITIAEKYGLNWTDIAKYNYIEDTRNIEIGTVLYLKNYAPIIQTPEVQETINRPEAPIIKEETVTETNTKNIFLRILETIWQIIIKITRQKSS